MIIYYRGSFPEQHLLQEIMADFPFWPKYCRKSGVFRVFFTCKFLIEVDNVYFNNKFFLILFSVINLMVQYET